MGPSEAPASSPAPGAASPAPAIESSSARPLSAVQSSSGHGVEDVRPVTSQAAFRQPSPPPRIGTPSTPSPRQRHLAVSPNGYLVSRDFAPQRLDPLAVLVQREADTCFDQIDRRWTGTISPGALLCQLGERGLPESTLPSLFYRMSRSGASISREDWRDGYSRFVKRAFMPLLAPRDPNTPVGTPAVMKEYSEDEVAAFERRAQALLEPKLAQLKTAWAIFDRSGKDETSLNWFNAFATVVARQAGRLATPRTPAAPDDLCPAVKLNFETFRPILARQDSALLGGGKAAKGKGGKKGKAKGKK